MVYLEVKMIPTVFCPEIRERVAVELACDKCPHRKGGWNGGVNCDYGEVE